VEQRAVTHCLHLSDQAFPWLSGHGKRNPRRAPPGGGSGMSSPSRCFRRCHPRSRPRCRMWRARFASLTAVTSVPVTTPVRCRRCAHWLGTKVTAPWPETRASVSEW